MQILCIDLCIQRRDNLLHTFYNCMEKKIKNSFYSHPIKLNISILKIVKINEIFVL